MRKLFTGFIILIVLVVAALLVAPSFIPADVYKDRITQAASDATGREVGISGDMHFAFFPRFEVVAENVTVGNVPGGTADYFARIGALAIGIEVMPLLKGVVSIDRFELNAPEINLEVDRNGDGNWIFDSDGAPNNDQAVTEGGFELNNISLRNVRLVDGRITYRNAQGAVETYEDINIELDLADLDSPLSAKGSLRAKNELINIIATVDRPRTLLDGGETHIQFDLDAGFGEVTFDGHATIADGQSPVFAGLLDMSIPSVRQLAAIAGQPIASANGFGKLDLRGNVIANDSRLDVENVKVSFDGMNGTGTLTIHYARNVPKLTGTLDIDKLDANIYLGEAEKTSANDWSTEPIDFAGLKSIDADLDLTADQVFFQDIKLGRSRLKLTINGGVLNAILNELNLYEGSGKGSLTIDAQRSTPVVRSEFSLNALQALPFLRDAMGLDRIEGIGNMTYSFTTSGQTQRQLVSNLNGVTSLKFLDGAWRGVNLASLARNVQTAFGQGVQNDAAGQEDVGEQQKTDFAELSGTFVIRNGQVTNDDFQMLNPFLRVLGGGSIDLINQTVRFKLRPKFVTSTQGQGGDLGMGGIAVPIIVEGPWSDLRYRPDFAGLLTNALIPGTGESTGNPIQDLIQGTIGRALGLPQPDSDNTKSDSNGTADQETETAQDGPDWSVPSDSESQSEPEKETPPKPVDFLFGILKQLEKD